MCLGPFDGLQGLFLSSIGAGGLQYAGTSLSLGAFLEQHAASLTPVLRRTLTPPVCASFAEVARFVRVFMSRGNDTHDSSTISEPVLAKCAAALCTEFRVTKVDDLGFGELSDILHLNKSVESSITPVILPIRALLHDHGVHSASLPSHGLNYYSDPTAVLRCIRASPYLMDLNSWLQWEVVFEPHHGSLRSFLQREDTSELAFMEDGASPQTAAILKYDQDATKEKLEAAFDGVNPEVAAVQLVSLFAQNSLFGNQAMLEAPLLQRSCEREASPRTLRLRTCDTPAHTQTSVSHHVPPHH